MSAGMDKFMRLVLVGIMAAAITGIGLIPFSPIPPGADGNGGDTVDYILINDIDMIVEIPDQAVDYNIEIKGWCGAYNKINGFLYNVSVSWSVVNSSSNAFIDNETADNCTFNSGTLEGIASWKATYQGLMDTVVFTIPPVEVPEMPDKYVYEKITRQNVASGSWLTNSISWTERDLISKLPSNARIVELEISCWIDSGSANIELAVKQHGGTYPYKYSVFASQNILKGFRTVIVPLEIYKDGNGEYKIDFATVFSGTPWVDYYGYNIFLRGYWVSLQNC